MNAIDYIKGGQQKDTYTHNDIVSTACPLCEDNKNFKLLKKEKTVLGVVQCQRCKLIYINPRLKHPEQVYWGDKKKYEEEAHLIFTEQASHHRDKNYLNDLKTISKYKPKGKFLDIGTNMGSFLRLARGKQWELIGIEPSTPLCEIAREKFNLNIINDFVENISFAPQTFDIITMTDVFEHLSNPKNLLKHIHPWLKEDGILFIKVPNAKFNLLKFWIVEKTLGRPSDLTFDSYEHVVHYTHQTLKLMLNQCGFKPLKPQTSYPVQLPVWHQYVGHYYQYPSPLFLDWKKYLSRHLLYCLALIENKLFNTIGYCSQNIVVIAKKY